MNIPFFKWQTWIENYLNKEFMRAALRIQRGKGNLAKPSNKTFVKTEALTKQKVLEQARFFQQEMEEHNKAKGKDLKVPPNVKPAGGHRRVRSTMNLD